MYLILLYFSGGNYSLYIVHWIIIQNLSHDATGMLIIALIKTNYSNYVFTCLLLSDQIRQEISVQFS